MTKGRKIILMISAILLMVIIGWYAKIGGFSSPTVEVLEVESCVLHGSWFKGRSADPELGELMKKVNDLALNSNGKYVACVYSQNLVEGKEEIADVFVGIEVADTNQVLDESFTFFTIPSRKVVEGKMDVSFSMSGKIAQGVAEYAEENNITLDLTTALEKCDFDPENSNQTVSVQFMLK